ncbi:hypothetical protein Dimus_039595 [Dionaea muscipula]
MACVVEDDDIGGLVHSPMEEQPISAAAMNVSNVPRVKTGSAKHDGTSSGPHLKVCIHSPLFDWGVGRVAVSLGEHLFRLRRVWSMEWPPSRPPDLGGRG